MFQRAVFAHAPRSSCFQKICRFIHISTYMECDSLPCNIIRLIIWEFSVWKTSQVKWYKWGQSQLQRKVVLVDWLLFCHSANRGLCSGCDYVVLLFYSLTHHSIFSYFLKLLFFTQKSTQCQGKCESQCWALSVVKCWMWVLLISGCGPSSEKKCLRGR